MKPRLKRPHMLPWRALLATAFDTEERTSLLHGREEGGCLAGHPANADTVDTFTPNLDNVQVTPTANISHKQGTSVKSRSMRPSGCPADRPTNAGAVDTTTPNLDKAQIAWRAMRNRVAAGNRAAALKRARI